MLHLELKLQVFCVLKYILMQKNCITAVFSADKLNAFGVWAVDYEQMACHCDAVTDFLQFWDILWSKHIKINQIIAFKDKLS